MRWLLRRLQNFARCLRSWSIELPGLTATSNVVGVRPLWPSWRRHPIRSFSFPSFGRFVRPTHPLRAACVQLLPRVNQVEAHGELCALLASPEAETRKAAAQVLKQVGGRSAFAMVVELCHAPDFPGRIEALEAFVPKARHGAIPMLARVLAVGSPQERSRALVWLGDAELMAKDVPAAVQVIASALDDPDDRIVARAIEALAAVADEEEFFARAASKLEVTRPLVARAVIEALGRYATPRSIDALGHRLRAGPTRLRLEVLESLEAIGTDDVLPVLAEGLAFAQLAVRERAARALANLTRSGKLDTARTILWLLRSRDVNVRRMAVEVARQVVDRGNTLWPRLIAMLRDEDWWVRERVMDALAEMAGEQLTRYLVGLLDDGSDVIRRFAIGALARIRDPKSLGALVRCAQNETDWWVREQAVQTIAELGDARAIPYLIELMGRAPESRYACVEALRALRAKEAVPRVVELLLDDDPDVRLACVRYLGEVDAREHAGPVHTLGEDPVARVRAAAKEVLERWAIVAEAGFDANMGYLDRLLLGMVQSNGDDLVIAGGKVPYIKVLGKVRPFANGALTNEQVTALLTPLLTREQLGELDALRDVDFSYEVRSTGQRFRGHVFRQLSGLAAVFRTVNGQVPELERLGLPPVVTALANSKNGLVLVGGPTGSGKSTTLAAIIDHINRTSSSRHIVTLEDPIEVLHRRKGCLINQREVGTHTRSFAAAMRSVLRQDPDVILVGEMRDLAMVSFAVTAAETGHLVFGTVHTSAADTTVDRLVNVFPVAQQPQVRTMLAESLQGVLCQHLIPRKDGPGRVLALEVMINNDAISNLIRKGKSFQIPAVVATSREVGMQSMDSELMRLYREGKIAAEEAYLRAVDKKAFETAFGWSTEGAVRGGMGRGAQAEILGV